jgi:hypothetical protein
MFSHSCQRACGGEPTESASKGAAAGLGPGMGSAGIGPAAWIQAPLWTGTVEIKRRRVLCPCQSSAASTSGERLRFVGKDASLNLVGGVSVKRPGFPRRFSGVTVCSGWGTAEEFGPARLSAGWRIACVVVWQSAGLLSSDCRLDLEWSSEHFGIKF